MQSRIARLLVAAGLATGSAAVHASVLSWANASGGAASVAVNWSPNQLPTAADDLTFNVLATYQVTFNASSAASRSHVYNRGTVTLVFSSPHTVSNGITVGDVSGNNANVTLTTGTATSNANVVIGNALGSTGVVTVNDDDADLVVAGGADLLVGNGGDGTLNVTGGGSVQVADQIIVGANSTSAAALTVSGSIVSSPFWRSTLQVLGTGQSRLGQGGDATVNISSGALATFGGDLVVANGSASASTVTVQTAGLFPATLSVNGNLLLGRNTSAGAAAGSGTLTVNSGGSTSVAGSLLVGGDPEGGTGLLHVAGTGAVTALDLIIGTGGTLQFNAGTIRVDGGIFSQAVAPVNVSDSTGIPNLILQNGATATLLSGGPSFRALVVGGPGASADGLFSVLSGSRVELSAVGSIAAVMGEGADDRGEIDVDGTGSALFSNSISSSINVGLGGVGRLEVTNGGLIDVGTLLMATETTGISTVFVQDPGSILQVRRDIFVGGFSGGAAGVGQIFVQNGGLLNVTDSGISTVVYQQGTISVADSTFTSTGTISSVGGAILLDDGTINATRVLLDSGQLGGGGLVNARLDMSNNSQLIVGSSLSLSAPQDLTVGIATATDGFSSGGGSGIVIHDHSSLTILDLNAAEAEVIQLINGTINAANGLKLHSTANVTGRGIINADVGFTFGGAITPDSAGLHFGGVLTRDGGTISGGVIAFDNGGGYTGDGTVACIVDAAAGSVITATGPLTMGNAATPAGVTLNGVLHCQDHSVTLLDSNGLALGTLTDMDGGSVNCAQGLVVNSGRTLEGRGGVTTPTLSVSGTLNPGDTQALGQGTGRIQVSGNVSFGSVNAHYNCQLAPFNEGPENDRIHVTGTATLTGNLGISLIPAYTPNPHDIFDIVTAASVVGRFSNETLPSGGAFGPVHVVYSPTRVTVVMCYANCDGSGTSPVLNANDFQCFLNQFAASDTYANCDGSTVTPVLNANDFQCFLNKFASGCP